MAEYIDRNKALAMRFRDLLCEDCLLYIPYRDVVNHLKSLPAADVVEVVRCKDCKHWGSTLAPEDLARAKTEADNDLVCDMWMSDGFTPDDYCSFAERR